MTSIVDIRKLLLEGKTGELTADHIIWHAPRARLLAGKILDQDLGVDDPSPVG